LSLTRLAQPARAETLSALIATDFERFAS